MPLVARVKVFFSELKRRRVFHVGTVYLVTAWGASLGASELFPAFGIPDWAVRFFVIAAMLGFPLALVLAWAFDITPEGVQLDGGPIDSEAAAKPAATTEWAAPNTMIASWSDKRGNQTKTFNKPCIIGRDPSADLIIQESKVSRQHARIYVKANQWWIEDLGSRNGTEVNGEMIRAATPLLSTRNRVVLFEGSNPLYLESADSTRTELAK